MAIDKRGFTAAPFFVLRTPLLAFDMFRAWGEGLSCSTAGSLEDLDRQLAQDRRILRERLGRVLERPDAREAVFVATPSLFKRMAKWQADPESKDGQKIEQALARYVARMTSRPTPFGLFSGCSLGAVSREGATPTRLALAGEETNLRCARLDFSYLTRLAESVEAMPDARHQLAYAPNSGAYRIGDRLHFTELVVDGAARRFALAAVTADAPLERALASAAGGATIPAIAEALVDESTTREEAEAYVTQLVDAHVLECIARPPITVADSARAFAADLADVPAANEVQQTLRRALDRLDELGARPLGAEPAAYESVARELEGLPAPVERERLFQVDLMKRSPEATVGTAVVDEIEKGVMALHRLAGATGEHGALDAFRRAFVERYDAREVPLLEALDEEVGIGYSEPGGYSALATPLLAGIPFPAGAPSAPTFAWGTTEALLAKKLDAARAAGNASIRLTDADLESLATRAVLPLPDSFCVAASLLAPSADALATGDFQVRLHSAGGPSGARMLGRFCPWDDELTSRVQQLLRHEEAQRPDAIFAEVVFHPQASRVGNLILRPPLRRHEIVFHARSGANPADHIALSDLLVSVRNGRIVLRSRSRGREVLPRLTSAHNFAGWQLPVYRFLCRLQGQGVSGALQWNWSYFSVAKHLPRVEYGRVVLAAATWRLDKEELRALHHKSPAARYRAVAQLRQALHLPRFIALHDADRVLPVDLDNSLSIDAFVDVVHDRAEAQISEALEHVAGAVATGPGGSYVNEIVLPMVRADQAPATTGARRVATPRLVARPLARELAPGSEWLYVKIYCGNAAADEVLTRVVHPLATEAILGGIADRWFFLRFGDPHPHLRVRLHGEGSRLVTLLPRFEERLRPMLRQGTVSRIQVDTYVREIERYGGDAGMLPCEGVFGADAEAAAQLIALLAEGTERDRWGWALLSIDSMLQAFGYDLAARHAFEERRAAAFASELRMEGDFEHALNKAYRRERSFVDGLLAPNEAATGLLARARAVLDDRSRALRPYVAALRSAERARQLTTSVDDILGSLVHMTANRMVRTLPRQQELVLHTYLSRSYASMLARQRARTAASSPEPGPALTEVGT
jgi:thiopeptide-type bacteriocin biosynthesis protein